MDGQREQCSAHSEWGTRPQPNVILQSPFPALAQPAEEASCYQSAPVCCTINVSLPPQCCIRLCAAHHRPPNCLAEGSRPAAAVAAARTMTSNPPASESSPLLSSKPPKPQRSVTFNPNVSTSSPSNSTPLRPSAHLPISPIGPKQNGGQPMLSALNSKLRRRNSQGAPLVPSSLAAPKIGPQRTTRNVQKLKLLPNPEQADEDLDEESGRDVYAQLTRIKEPTARRDAARLGKADRERLPRVTAYCTASSYRMDELMRYLKGKAKTRGAAPKLYDECIYTPYDYNFGKKAAERDERREPGAPMGLPERRHSDSAVEIDGNTEQRRGDLIDLHSGEGDGSLENAESSMQAQTEEVIEAPSLRRDTQEFDTHVHTPEVFLFNYGTVVIWGMNLLQEQRFLREIAKFENEKLGKDDVQTEDFNFYYTHEYQARIYNDFISLRDKKNYMTKLAISHALAQSVKVSGPVRLTLSVELTSYA